MTRRGDAQTFLPGRAVFQALYEELGPQGWWPAQTGFEMIIGSVLVQHTAWRNVETSLQNLVQARALTPQGIAGMKQEDLVSLIRPSGFMQAKAGTCQAISRWLMDMGLDESVVRPEDGSQAAGDPQPPLPDMRENLLSVKGIGQETADVIRLYAFHQKCFIWDVYSRRMIAALGLPDYPTYQAAKDHEAAFLDISEFTLPELGEYHGLIVEAGKRSRAAGSWEWLIRRIPR